MSGWTIHTDMPLEELSALLAEFEDEDGPSAGDALQEYTRGAVKEPTCFFGWGEPQSAPGCLPHSMVEKVNTDAYDMPELARVIISSGYQVVITDADDWSDQPSLAMLPCLYMAYHTH